MEILGIINKINLVNYGDAGDNYTGFYAKLSDANKGWILRDSYNNREAFFGFRDFENKQWLSYMNVNGKIAYTYIENLSDSRLKNIYNDYLEKTENFFDSLKPIAFKYTFDS